MPGGIYNSQVIDVVRYLNGLNKTPVKLIVFISLRSFANNKKRIKANAADAIVLPMFPKITNWKYNKHLLFILCLIYRPSAIVARGLWATGLALLAKKNKLVSKVCYDGRGAILAEIDEYKIFEDQQLKNEAVILKQKALTETDMRIAVSEQLVAHWQENANYTDVNHVVIPCTIDSTLVIPDVANYLERRIALGYKANDVIIVYSGSIAGWQSFDTTAHCLEELLTNNPQLKILFLSQPHQAIEDLQKQYNGRVNRLSVSHDKVPEYLSVADYGWLVREQSVTNEVASPVKFAEYIACGLKVIISNNLGDYSNWVLKHNLGYTEENLKNDYHLNSVSVEERKRMQSFAKEHLYKSSATNHDNYIRLVETLMSTTE